MNSPVNNWQNRIHIDPSLNVKKVQDYFNYVWSNEAGQTLLTTNPSALNIVYDKMESSRPATYNPYTKTITIHSNLLDFPDYGDSALN